MRNRDHRVKGFTLLELLVVIAIIAVIAGLLLPVLSKVRRYSKKTQAKELMYQVRTAFKQYLVDYRKFPDMNIERTDADVMAVLRGTTHNSLGHKYMDVTTNELVYGYLDPWNEQYWISVDNNRGGDAGNGAYNGEVTIGSYPAVQDDVALLSKGEDKADGTPAQRRDDVRTWVE